MKKQIKKSRKKSKINDDDYFSLKSIDLMNTQILKEMSSSKFKIPEIRNNIPLSTLSVDFDQLIKVLSKDVSNNKRGGGEPEMPGTTIAELEEMAEKNQKLSTQKGKLTAAVESVISTKFPYYIRMITVLIKIFVCLIFNGYFFQQNMGKKSSEYISKLLLGLLMQYPDVCATLAGNFLSNLGAIGLQLKNLPVIKHIISFIDSLTMGGLTAANKYLIIIGEFFENNASRTTTFSTYFQFIVKTCLEKNINITDPSTWGEVLSDPFILSQCGGALFGVLTKMFCPKHADTCQFVSLIMRVPCFGFSIFHIAKDFLESSLPLIRYYIYNERNLDMAGLCRGACFGIFNSGDAILGPKGEDSGEREQRLDTDFQKMYGNTEEDQKLRFLDTLEPNKNINDIRSDEFDAEWDKHRKVLMGKAEEKFKKLHPSSGTPSKQQLNKIVNSIENETAIDRIVNSKSFDKFQTYIAVPVNQWVKGYLNGKIRMAMGIVGTVPSMANFVLGTAANLGERVFRQTVGRITDNVRTAIPEEGTQYKQLTNKLYGSTVERVKEHLIGQKENFNDKVYDFLESKNIQGLKDMYKNRENLIKQSTEFGKEKASDWHAWQELVRRKEAERKARGDWTPGWYNARKYLKDQGVVESGNIRDYMNKEGVNSAITNENRQLTALNKKIDDLDFGIDEKKNKLTLNNGLTTQEAVKKAKEAVEKAKESVKEAQAQAAQAQAAQAQVPQDTLDKATLDQAEAARAEAARAQAARAEAAKAQAAQAEAANALTDAKKNLGNVENELEINKLVNANERSFLRKIKGEKHSGKDVNFSDEFQKLKKDLQGNYDFRKENNENLLMEVDGTNAAAAEVAAKAEATKQQLNTNSGFNSETENNLKTVLGSTYSLGLGLDKGINDYSEDEDSENEDSENEDSENEETSVNLDEKEDNFYLRGGKRKGASQRKKIFSKEYNKKTKNKKRSIRLKSLKRILRKRFKKTPRKSSKKNN